MDMYVQHTILPCQPRELWRIRARSCQICAALRRQDRTFAPCAIVDREKVTNSHAHAQNNARTHKVWCAIVEISVWMIACGKKHLHRNKRRHIEHDIYLVSALKRPDMERRGSGGTCAREKRSYIREMQTHITPQQPPRAHVGVRKCCMQARESMWQYTGIDVSANMYEDLYWAIMYRQHAACTASNSHALTPSRACIMHLSSRMRGCAHADQLSQKSVLPDFRVIPLWAPLSSHTSGTSAK